MAAVTYESLGLGAIDSGVVIGTYSEGSAFQKFGRKVPLPKSGTVVTKVSGVEAFGVGEGGAKVASGAAEGVTLGSNKLHSTIVQTEELWTYADSTASALMEEQPKAEAKTFDAYVAGIAAEPAAYSNWTDFGHEDISEVTIGTGDQASVDWDDAASTVEDGIYNAIVLSTSMLGELKRQRNSTNGSRIFDIEGDIASGTIDGLPYATFPSSTKVAYLGNFDNFVYGVEEFDGGLEGSAYRIKDAGSITDSAAVTHNLTSENKVAVIHELFIGSQVVNPASFVKLVPASEES